MYIPLRRVVLSLPTEDETPEEFGQTDMIGGHADPGMPQLPSVLRRCWLGDRKGIRPVKTEWWGAGVGYLSGARCRLAYGPADATATRCLLLR